jgi:hypothetical protein
MTLTDALAVLLFVVGLAGIVYCVFGDWSIRGWPK